jgi:16S rRNA (cytidine1402-2'-O)-methyltransferase
MKANDSPTIFFESPKRILKTLKIILNDYKNCNVTFIRELTKKNEEVINSTILNLIETLEQRKKIYGEITLIIEPLINENKITISKKEIAEVSEKLLKDGLSISEISKTISKDLNISKREIYQLLINK